MGLIAACVPSLKPLVSRALKLSSYQNTSYNRRYGDQYGGSRNTGLRTIGGGASHLRSRHQDEYGMEELESRDGKNSDEIHLGGGQSTATATFYKGSSVGGSEEGVLEPEIQSSSPPHRDAKGIIRTTEVIVS